MEAKMYRFSEGGKLKEMTPCGQLPLYSRVYSFPESIWAVIGDNNIVKISENYDDDYFSNPYKKLDSHTLPLSQKFGIGFYYDDINKDFRFTKEQVDNAIKKADAFIEQQKIKAKEKVEKDKKEVEFLKSNFDHLKINESDDIKITKTNIVADLKKNFHGIKFSVRKDGYNTYFITWENGPSLERVKKITDKFESYSTSNCGDFRDYNPSNFNRVFGGVKYILETREYCDKIHSAIEKCNDYESKRRMNSLLYSTDIPSDINIINFDDIKLSFE